MTRIPMPRPLCPCGRPFKARGLCSTHYRAALRGNPEWVAQLSDVNAPGAQFVYACDWLTCETVGLPSLVAARGQGIHYCSEHYQMTRCRVCRRHMRPEGTPENLWPETVSKGWDDKCHSCSLGMFEQIYTKALPTEEVKVIRRMIEDRFSDPDDRLLVMSSLIGADVD